MFEYEKKNVPPDQEPRRIIIRNYSEQDDATAVAMVARVIAIGRNCKNLTEYKPKVFGEDDCAIVKHQLNLHSDTFYVYDHTKIIYHPNQIAAFEKEAGRRAWKAAQRVEARRIREQEKLDLLVIEC
jgi:hypothetical protein